MPSLYLLAVVVLVEAVTNLTKDFSRLCSGECPANWTYVGFGCALVPGNDLEKAREVCREERAEYTRFFTLEDEIPVIKPICLVERETQCQCGRKTKKKYPWRGESLS